MEHLSRNPRGKRAEVFIHQLPCVTGSGLLQVNFSTLLSALTVLTDQAKPAVSKSPRAFSGASSGELPAWHTAVVRGEWVQAGQ